jgi:hypothetical protein
MAGTERSFDCGPADPDWKLGEEQRDMVRPHLEQFLTGPLKDEM